MVFEISPQEYRPKEAEKVGNNHQARGPELSPLQRRLRVESPPRNESIPEPLRAPRNRRSKDRSSSVNPRGLHHEGRHSSNNSVESFKDFAGLMFSPEKPAENRVLSLGDESYHTKHHKFSLLFEEGCQEYSDDWKECFSDFLSNSIVSFKDTKSEIEEFINKEKQRRSRSVGC